MSEKVNYTFVEKGGFVPIMGVIFAVIGLMLTSDYFANLATMDTKQSIIAIVGFVGGGVLGVFIAIALRRKI